MPGASPGSPPTQSRPRTPAQPSRGWCLSSVMYEYAYQSPALRGSVILLVAKLAGVRVMWPNAGVYDFFSQCWPYAAFGALVVVSVLLWKTWKRVRRIEGKVSRLRADLFTYNTSNHAGDLRKSNRLRSQSLEAMDHLMICPSSQRQTPARTSTFR
jgi:hypothetical protein